MKDNPRQPPTEKLADLMDIWDRVCDAADPDDRWPLPTWEEVWAKELTDWGSEPWDREKWIGYMHGMVFGAAREVAREYRAPPHTPSYRKGMRDEA